jgi:hypothetical protein
VAKPIDLIVCFSRCWRQKFQEITIKDSTELSESLGL